MFQVIQYVRINVILKYTVCPGKIRPQVLIDHYEINHRIEKLKPLYLSSTSTSISEIYIYLDSLRKDLSIY